MPIEIEILYEDFSTINYYIPLSIMRGEKDNINDDHILLKDWEWVNETYQIDLDNSDKKIKKMKKAKIGHLITKSVEWLKKIQVIKLRIPGAEIYEKL